MSQDREDRIINKLEVLDQRLDNVDKTLVLQEANLKEHMKRSDLLERSLEHLREEFKPVQKHVVMVEGTMKFLGLIALILTMIAGILEILGVL